MAKRATPARSDWPPARLRLERPRETLAALACLGIDATRRAAAGVRRRRRGRRAKTRWPRASAAILRPGDLVVTTWRYDAHPDHEACARACAAAAAACGASLFETPVWGWHWSAPGDGAMPLAQARKLALTPAMLARKRAALTCFHSQTGADGRSDGTGPSRACHRAHPPPFRTGFS